MRKFPYESEVKPLEECRGMGVGDRTGYAESVFIYN